MTDDIRATVAIAASCAALLAVVLVVAALHGPPVQLPTTRPPATAGPAATIIVEVRP